MEADLVRRAGIPYTEIPAGQVAGMGLQTLPNLMRVLKGTLASRRILQAFKPDVLLFTGGFVAVPMALAASGLPGTGRVPSLVYVPDIEPGMALKLLARFASVIALTVEESRTYFQPARPTVVTGYPLRPELDGWTRERGLAHLNLQADRFTLLVSGGSKGARSINRALGASLPQLLDPQTGGMQVIHLTGGLDWEEMQSARASLPEGLRPHYHPMPYLHEMGAALAAADLAITRAGASVLGELPRFGVPAILVPYPHAWRYQKVNADYLEKRGGAVMLEDARLPDALAETIQNLKADPGRLEAMRRAMITMAVPDAARRLADALLRLAGQGAPVPPDRNSREISHG
jgi:UDP-N-acetylglucosamine--N-acetylmuramyl-(pentapeptide) pyrophosphoryl-undecaprenol N-acetylglucosamine transferase